MKILAVIPARGGSKGIPRKNIRLMGGKPLIYYAIRNALECKLITDVVVTTDDQEIAYIAKTYGAMVIMRSQELSEDNVTLDPVVLDAVKKTEQIVGYLFDYVITMQPTSPLLKRESLERAIEYAINNTFDCVISVINKPHLSWKREDEKLVPNYIERVNRQYLPDNYIETGAFVISSKCLIHSNTRIGGDIAVFKVTDSEGIDIDDTSDWILCDALLKKKKIVFRFDGYNQLGMGHVYNCITLAYALIEHDVLLVVGEKSIEGIKKIQETKLPYRIIKNENDIYGIIEEFKPDIWVNDRLDTDEEYIKKLKLNIPRVITIEDLGNGTKYADAVINALYTDDDLKGRNIFNGWRYVCLRDEFQIEPISDFSDEVSNIMLMFGGTDPDNYTKKLYDIIINITPQYPSIKFNFILGIGYDAEKNGVITVEDRNIFVYPNVARVTRFMKEADIAITSQGRAIFEFAAMGVPAIVLAQNIRETSHSFASMRHGFINLGLGIAVQDEVIENTLMWLINTKSVRKNMYDIMKKYPLREGLQRVKGIILGDTVNSML